MRGQKGIYRSVNESDGKEASPNQHVCNTCKDREAPDRKAIGDAGWDVRVGGVGKEDGKRRELLNTAKTKNITCYNNSKCQRTNYIKKIKLNYIKVLVTL